jgi:branched-chain amino acid transport system permease protein
MTGARALVPLLLAAGGAASAAFWLAGGSGYAAHVLAVAGCYALAALGYQLVFGHAGALSLAQGSFMGIGAYVAAILATRFGWGLAALPASVVLPVLLALVVGAPVLRLGTHYFALATLILAQVALLVATQWESVTGGANGLSGIGPIALPGFAPRSAWPGLLVVWLCVAAGALAAWRALAGTQAARFAVIRQDRAAAGAIGIDAGRMRLLAFVAASAYAGLAGGLYAHAIGVISPDILGLPVMVTCLTIVVVGGPRRIAGAIAGAVLITVLPEWFRGLREAYLFAYGAALLVAIVALPDGLVGAAERLVARAWPGTPAVPPAIPRPRGGEKLSAGLRVEAVSRSFGGVRALDSVSLAVAPGEVVGVIGPNGSGKTTLLNVITGLERPDAGRVVVGDDDVTGAPPHRIARLGVARSFQAPSLVPGMRVVDAVAVAGAGPWRIRRGEAMGLLAAWGIAGLAPLACASLPPPSRRLVEIARALALRPGLLLLDEPAAGLPEVELAALAARLRGLAEAGMGLLVVEHNLPFLAGLADRLVCLDAGRVIASGPPAAVRRDPRVVAAYLGTP